MKRKIILIIIVIILSLSFTLTLLPRGGYAGGRSHAPMDAPYSERK